MNQQFPPTQSKPIKPNKSFTKDPTAALYSFDYDLNGNQVDQIDIYYGSENSWVKETFLTQVQENIQENPLNMI